MKTLANYYLYINKRKLESVLSSFKLGIGDTEILDVRGFKQMNTSSLHFCLNQAKFNALGEVKIEKLEHLLSLIFTKEVNVDNPSSIAEKESEGYQIHRTALEK